MLCCAALNSLSNIQAFKDKRSLNSVTTAESFTATVRSGHRVQTVAFSNLCIDDIFQVRQVARTGTPELFFQSYLHYNVRQILTGSCRKTRLVFPIWHRDLLSYFPKCLSSRPLKALQCLAARELRHLPVRASSLTRQHYLNRSMVVKPCFILYTLPSGAGPRRSESKRHQEPSSRQWCQRGG